MNKETIMVGVAALVIGGIVGYGIAEKEDKKYSERADNTVDVVPAGMHRMHDGSMMGNYETESGMNHMMGMLVTSERAFIEGMIPHHQEAVDTAKEVIARGGTTPEIKKLAENIVVAQEQEIAAMKQWYKAWYGEEYEDNEIYEPMMRELQSLSGAELDQAFLEDMIMHHMGAIMMAQSVQRYIEHDEIGDLTRAIVTTQSAEIAKMQDMLTDF